MEPTSDIYRTAKWLLERNYSVIPVGHDKKPFFEWKPYQTERATNDDLVKWWTKNPDANVAVVTGEISNLLAIDIDTQEGYDNFDMFLPDDLVTPVCTTPNKGWHFWFKHVDGLVNKARVIEGTDVRTTGGYIIAPPSVNGNGKGYAWLEDLRPSDVDLSVIPKEIEALLKQSLSSTYIAKPVPDSVSSVSNVLVKGTRDEHLFYLANHLIKGRMDIEDVRKFVYFFANHAEPPFDLKEAEAKIKSALTRADTADRNLSDEIKQWCLLTPGDFLLTSIDMELGLLTRADKNNRSKILERLVSDGVIERVGRQRGHYRRVDTEVTKIEILSTPTAKPLNLKFPLDLENYFKPMPKNIILIAGSPNSGKTAFALRFAAMNLNKALQVRYISSEMGGDEFNARLADFEDIPPAHFKMLDAEELSTNVHDRVLPNGVTIIDYLEVTDAFYLVAEYLRKIYDKLKKGVAIVFLQKDYGVDSLGRGASFSLEKPRLYVTLSNNPPEGGIAKIIKCKNRANKAENPDGMMCHYSIRNGNEVRMKTGWKHPKPMEVK